MYVAAACRYSVADLAHGPQRAEAERTTGQDKERSGARVGGAQAPGVTVHAVGQTHERGPKRHRVVDGTVFYVGRAIPGPWRCEVELRVRPRL